MRHAILTALLLATATTACAAAPNEASGRYVEEGSDIALSHATVLRQDDAEHVRDNGPGLRVLLSDVAVPVEAIEGGVFPTVYGLAKAGKVHGLLFDLDPARPDEMVIVVLDFPAGTTSSRSITLADGAGLWKTLAVANGRMTAEFKPRPELSFRFSAPIAEDPVREDIRGAAARAHPLAAMARAQVDAFARGDLAASTAQSSARRKVEQAQASAAELASIRQHWLPQWRSGVHAIDRIVIRGNVATALAPDGPAASFIREDGAWKID